VSNPNDETRVPPPVPLTLSQTPDARTPTFRPDNATAAQTPDQISSLLAASDRDPPPVVPGYEILSKLGAGGMGVVYRARELAFDRDVAVKVLKAKYPQHSPILRRFLEEARITAQLQHPAIPPVHHIGELADGRPFLAMKLIKGDTLADLLAAEGAVRGRFMPAFAQVCQAVAYAHAHKVIHRDLKPHNVMVGAYGEVQVMDWGLAKVLGAPEPASAEPGAEVSTEIRAGRDPDSETQAGSVMGTPAYMAPEQAAGEVDKVDERADVFGLGAVLCAVLTGDPPYTGSGKDSVRVKAIRCDTVDAFARLDASGADAELIALCKVCLSADRDARPRNASELSDAVSAHLAAVEERAKQAELERARTEERRKKRRVQWALAGSVLLVLVAGTFGAVVTRLWRKAETQRDAADKAQQGEETARKEIEREREKLAGVEYGRTIQVAYQECRENNLAAARALLRGTQSRFRGWEWNYVNHLANDGRLFTLEGHAHNVLEASFSADGTRIVTGSVDNTAKVWDAKSGAELLTLKGHTKGVRAASFSADGTRIVTGSADNTAKVWDAKSGAEVLTLKHTSEVRAASFSPDGTRLVTASGEHGKPGEAKVWEVPSGKLEGIAKTSAEVLTLKGHTGEVRAASFSTDGTRIVTASREHLKPGEAKVWDARSGAELLTLKGHSSEVCAARFSPDGARIVTAGGDVRGNQGEATVWDAKTGAVVLTLKGHTKSLTAASFTADGARIVTGSWDGTVKEWDGKTGAEVFTRRCSQEWWPVSFSAAGTRILTTGLDGTATVWNLKSGFGGLTLKGHTDSVDSAAISADGARVVTKSSDGVAKVWDAKTGAELLALKGHTVGLSASSFSMDGTRIVTGSNNMGVKVWDAKSGVEVLALKGYAPTVAFSADGTRIVTGRTDQTAKVWDTKTGAEVLTLAGHKYWVRAALFSADGTRIVTASEDGCVRVWDAKNGTQVSVFSGGSTKVKAASLNADGTRVVMSVDNTAKVWAVKCGAELLTLKGHTGEVRSVAFSTDGTRVVTASDDNTAKVWDAKSGAELLTLKGHTGEVRTASFSADGTCIVTGSNDKTAKVWFAPPPIPVAPASQSKP